MNFLLLPQSPTMEQSCIMPVLRYLLLSWKMPLLTDNEHNSMSVLQGSANFKGEAIAGVPLFHGDWKINSLSLISFPEQLLPPPPTPLQGIWCSSPLMMQACQKPLRRRGQRCMSLWTHQMGSWSRDQWGRAAFLNEMWMGATPGWEGRQRGSF